MRPPPEVQRLGGVPALLTMSAYGPLTVSVEVRDGDDVLGESEALHTVILDPAVLTRIGLAAGAVLAGTLVTGFVTWRIRRARRRI